VKLKGLVGLLEGQKWESAGGKWRLGASRFYASMWHIETCKTVCGSEEIDQNRAEIA
ncbi:MAG: hypothetical protein HW390_3056, partial [Candidatus Brocadiaceae bacterium]|nr:hypothetical protein [Candidatus Brocadiaceae bacterium]